MTRKYKTPLPPEPDEPPHVLRTAIIVGAIVCTAAALIAVAVIAFR